MSKFAEGQWVTFRKNGENFSGYIIELNGHPEFPNLEVVITDPKNRYTDTIEVSTWESKVHLMKETYGTITTGDLRFLIDAALIFNHKEWFMQLTKRYNRMIADETEGGKNNGSSSIKKKGESA